MDERYWSDPNGASQGSGRLKINMGGNMNMGAGNGTNTAPPEKKPEKKPKKKRKIFKTIMIILLVLIILFLAVAGTLFVFLKPPAKTVFLIAGTDEGGTRTDTIMIGVMDAESDCDITLLSIPRDTLITVSKENYEKMCESYPEPSGRTMQINTIYHFAGEELGMKMLEEEIERNFDIEIDYYAKIDFDAFGYMVDSIGGVSFDVPMDMDYEDPLQDLAIHLKKGEQVLDGDKAEQLMRYRAGYAMQDLGRIEVQQQFVKAFITEAVKPKNVVKNYKAYITACEEYVDTNFKVKNMFKYARCIFKFKNAEFNTDTVPGNVNSDYRYIVDYDEFDELYGEKFR